MIKDFGVIGLFAVDSIAELKAILSHPFLRSKITPMADVKCPAAYARFSSLPQERNDTLPDVPGKCDGKHRESQS